MNDNSKDDQKKRLADTLHGLDKKVLAKIDRFLKIRPRSTKELRDYLTFRRKLSANESDRYFSFYKEIGAVDDYKFTKWYYQSRLNSSKYAPGRIRQELKVKGIGRELISMVETDIGLESITSTSESKLISQLTSELKRLRDRGGESGNSQLDLKTKRKLFSKLQRRGYSFAEIQKTFNSIAKS